MKVQILSNYDKCFSLVQELKLNAGKYKRCLMINNHRKRMSEGSYQPILITRKKRLCGEKVEVDGEQYYK